MHENVGVLLKIGKTILGKGCNYSEKSWNKPLKPAKKWRTTYNDCGTQADAREKAQMLREALRIVGLDDVTVTISDWGTDITMLYPIEWRTTQSNRHPEYYMT